MILVNLLPAELIPKEIKRISIPYKPIMLGVFTVFILFALLNLYFSIQIHKEKRALEKQWAVLKTPSEQADQLQNELGASVLAEIDFYDSFADPPLEMAQTMSLISNYIPKSVWLSTLKFERKLKDFQLNLIGFSESSARESKLVEVQNFVDALKEDIERLLNPEPAPPGAVKRAVSAAVTTSSRQDEGASNDLMEFKASLQTEGFASTHEEP